MGNIQGRQEDKSQPPGASSPSSPGVRQLTVQEATVSTTVKEEQSTSKQEDSHSSRQEDKSQPPGASSPSSPGVREPTVQEATVSTTVKEEQSTSKQEDSHSGSKADGDSKGTHRAQVPSSMKCSSRNSSSDEEDQNYQPSDESQNFTRLTKLVLDISNDVMRDILRDKIGTSNVLLAKELSDGRKDFLSNAKSGGGKGLSKAEQDILYPKEKGKWVSYEDLDFSLMYKVARNLPVCYEKIEKNRNLWGKEPEKNDQSLLACIERLRYSRNKFFAHAKSSEINTPDFNDMWQYVLDALKWIKNHVDQRNMQKDYHKEARKLKKKPVDKDAVKNAKKVYKLEKEMEGMREEMREKVREFERKDEELQEKLEQRVQKAYMEIRQERQEALKKLRGDDSAGTERQNFNTSVSTQSPLKQDRQVAGDPDIFLHSYVKSDKYYVETRAYHNVKEILEKEGRVVITGRPGYGKTELAVHLLFHFLKQQFHLQIVQKPSQISLSEGKTVVFIDDMLGASTLRTEKAHEWWDIPHFLLNYTGQSDEINKKFDVFFIMTTRTHILDKAQLECPAENEFLDERCLLDISSNEWCLTDQEKRAIVEKKIEQARESDRNVQIPTITDEQFKQIYGSDPPLGFPLCAKIFPYQQLYHSQEGDTVVSFFTRPVGYLKGRVQSHVSKEKKPCHRNLFLLLLFSRKEHKTVDLKDEKECSSLFKKYQLEDLFDCKDSKMLGGMKNIAMTLQETYIREKDDGSFEFLHESIYEAVQAYFVEHYFDKAIQILDLNTILNVVTAKHQERPHLGTVCVKDENMHILAKRLIGAILQEHIATVCTCSVLKDADFVNEFVTCLQNCCIQDFSAYTEEEDLHTGHKLAYIVLDKEDKETKERLLYHSLQNGCNDLSRKLLEIVDPKKHLSGCLIGGCNNADISVHLLKEVLDKGANPNYSSLSNQSKMDLNRAHWCALEAAASVRNEEAVRLLLNHGAIIPHRDWGGWKVLHCAAKTTDEQLCNSDLINAVSQYQPHRQTVANGTGEDQSFYQVLVRRLDSQNLNQVFLSLVPLVQMTPAIFEVMKELNVDINCTQTNGDNFMHIVLKTLVFEFIPQTSQNMSDDGCSQTTFNAGSDNIQTSADTKMSGVQEPIQLQDSTKKIKQDTIVAMGDHGCNPNWKNKLGQTPLMTELSKDEVDLDVIDCLMQNGANPNEVDNYGKTALHLCVGSSLSDETTNSIVQKLIRHSVDISTEDRFKLTPLMLSVRKFEHRKSTFRTLVENISASESTENPVHLCICSPDMQETEVKIEALDMVKDLVNLSRADVAGKTPLMICVEFCPEMTELFCWIMGHDEDINRADTDGNTLLHHLALRLDNTDCVSKLFDCITDKRRHEMNVNLPNKEGLTPVMIAIKCVIPNIHFVRNLLHFGADINITNEKGEDLLHQVITQPKEQESKVIHRLQSKPQISPDILDESTGNMVFPLFPDSEDHSASGEYYPYMPTSSQRTGVAEIVKHVVEDQNFKIDKRDQMNRSYLHYCATSIHSDQDLEEIINVLLEKGLDVDDKGNDGNSVLDLAVLYSPTKFQVIKLMFNKSKQDCKKASKNILKKLAKDHALYPDLIKFLSESKYLGNEADRTRNVFHILAQHGYETARQADDKNIFSMLREKCSIDHVDSRGETPLHIACTDQGTPYTCLRNFIDHGADVNKRNNDEESALHVIVKSGKNDFEVNKVMRLMLDSKTRKANLNLKNRKKRTALSLAVLHKDDRVQVIKTLVDKGADVNVCDRDGNSPLHHCMSLEKSDHEAVSILEILLSSNTVDLNLQNEERLTPLHVAMKHTSYSRVACIMRLLNQGCCEMDNVDRKGCSMMYNICDHLDGHDVIVGLERMIRGMLLVVYGGETCTKANDGRNAISICGKKRLGQMEKLLDISRSNQDEMIKLMDKTYGVVADQYNARDFAEVCVASKLNVNMKRFVEKCLPYLVKSSLMDEGNTSEERGSDFLLL